MRKATLICLVLLALAPALSQAQPVIRATNGILNASSALPDVAQGSWFVIYGTGLGPSTIAIQYPYTATLAGTSITFTPASGGTPVSALLYYTLATQVAAMLPSSTPAGTYNVTVTYSGRPSAAVSANVVARNFGFATQTANGQGVGVVVIVNADGSEVEVGPTVPAKAGDILTLYATGLGSTSPSYSPGQLPTSATSITGTLQVTIGSTTLPAANILYAGISPLSAGLYQINLRLPASLPSGKQPVR